MIKDTCPLFFIQPVYIIEVNDGVLIMLICMFLIPSVLFLIKDGTIVP